MKNESFCSINQLFVVFLHRKLKIVIMKNAGFPPITTVVQADPWEKGHVVRITSFRPVTNTPKQHKPIVANVLPK